MDGFHSIIYPSYLRTPRTHLPVHVQHVHEEARMLDELRLASGGQRGQRAAPAVHYYSTHDEGTVVVARGTKKRCCCCCVAGNWLAQTITEPLKETEDKE